MIPLGIDEGGRSEGGTTPRPLVVKTQPYDDEMLASVVARATRANVLGSTQIILRDVGLDLSHPGTVGQEIGDLAPRLATTVGCDRVQIERLIHPYLSDDRDSLVRWGDGTLRRSDLILDRRRISPAAVSRVPYVRALWQCRHLPYDAETGELLLEACPDCKATLRWSRAWGVGTCEHCRSDLTLVHRARLDESMLASYRNFASLSSVVPHTLALARSALAPELCILALPILIDLITALGVAIGSKPRPTGRRRLRQLADADRAEASARGMELIEDWPSVARRRLQRVRSSGTSEAELLLAVRSLGDERAFAPEMTQIIRAAFPEIFQDSRRVLGSLETEVTLPRQVAEASGLRPRQIRDLVDARILPVVCERIGRRRNTQLAKAPALEFAAIRRSSKPLTEVERALGLPRYGIELLIDQGLLEQERHPGILLVETAPRINGASFDRLLGILEERTLAPERATNGVHLRTWSRRIGGGCKPWHEIIANIVDGSITISGGWSRSAGAFANRVVVERNTPSLTMVRWWPRTRTSLVRDSLLSQRDACEILNLDAFQIRPLVEAGVLSFSREGKRLATSVHEVVAYAAIMIPPAELAHRLGTRADAVHAIVDRWDGVERIPGGWRREQVGAVLRSSDPQDCRTAALLRGRGSTLKKEMMLGVAPAEKGKIMNASFARAPEIAIAATPNQIESDLNRFLCSIPDMCIAGEYPGDPRLNAIVLPAPITRAILRDLVMEDDIAWIGCTEVADPITANDVLSALWMHRDYLDRKLVMVHAKPRTSDTIEIGIRLEVVKGSVGLDG